MKGFTILELLVIIVLIGILAATATLAAIATPSCKQYVDKQESTYTPAKQSTYTVK